MDLLGFRTALIDGLQPLLPPRVKVLSHPGRFDLAELKRYSLNAPCVLVAVMGGDELLSLALDGPVELAAYVLTKNVKGASHDAANLQLVSLLLGLLKARRLGGDNAGAVQALRFKNLFSASLGEESVSLTAVTWSQNLSLELPTEQSLGSFQQLFADFFDAPPGTQPETQDQTHLQGA